MNLITNVCKAILFLGLTFAVVYPAIVVPRIFDQHLTSIEKSVNLQLSDTRSQTLTLVNDRSNKIVDLIGKLATKEDNRLASIQSQTFSTINKVSDDLNGQLTVANKTLTDTVNPWQKLPDSINARLDIVGSRVNNQTDCAINSICWQNLVTDDLVQARYTFRDISTSTDNVNKALPNFLADSKTISNSFAVSLPKITNNFASITTSVDSMLKPRWYDRIVTYGFDALSGYLMLNPVTSSVRVVNSAFSSSVKPSVSLPSNK